MSNLYNLRALGPAHYQMAKFDSDFNVAAVYNLLPKGKGYTCDCPASTRMVKLKPCKHQRMMILMMGAVNTNRFYNPDNGSWLEPLAHEPAVIDNGDLSGVAVEIAEEVMNITATEIHEREIESDNRRRRAEEALIEPLLDKALEIAQKHVPLNKPISTPIVTRRI